MRRSLILVLLCLAQPAIAETIVWGDGDGFTRQHGCDLCAGYDDGQDEDGDGVPDGCDVCAGDDNTGDGDGDGVCTDLDCNDTDPTIAYLDLCGVCGGDSSSCAEIFADDFESGSLTNWITAR